MTKTEKLKLNSGRLDKALSEALNISRATAQKVIEQGITIDGKIADKSALKILEGEYQVEYTPLEAQPSQIVPNPDIKVETVYEDNDLMVVNKPRGLVVHTAPGHSTDTLVNYLVTKENEFEFDEEEMKGGRPGIVHRLDKDTSGLLLVAKTAKAEKGLQAQIKVHSVNRQYLALVHGVAQEDRFTCDIPLKKPNHTVRKAMPDSGGLKAVTHFEKLGANKEYSLLKCTLETGRTHQIRAHLAYIGLPIVGDPLYSPYKLSEFNQGQILCAYRIAFTHPCTNKKMEFVISPDKYFLDALKKLLPEFKIVKDWKKI